MKSKSISRYEAFKEAPISIQERAHTLAAQMELLFNEGELGGKAWEILHQEENDLVALNKKRETAHPTMEEVLDCIHDVLPGLKEIGGGQWNEWTGSKLLSEDEWGSIESSVKELENLLRKFDHAK